MIKKILEKLQFSQGEIKIYTFLIKISKEETAKEISLLSKLSLSKTYEILEKLKLKNIISQISRNNVKYYVSLPLESLQSLIEEHKNNFKKQEDELKTFIKIHKPEKCEKFNTTKVRIFSEYNGIKTFYLELEKMKKNEEYLGFMIDKEILKNKTILRLIDNFHKIRSEQGKISKIIIEDNENYNTKRLKKNPYKQYKFKATKIPFPKNLSIIGNKVIQYNINVQENKFEIIEIESESLSKNYTKLFNNIWNT